MEGQKKKAVLDVEDIRRRTEKLPAEDVDAVTFIHLSDLHIVDEHHGLFSPHKGANSSVVQMVTKIIEDFASWKQKPFVVITGDITNGSAGNEDVAAHDLLKPLLDNNFKLLIVPGNHDFRKHGWENKMLDPTPFHKNLMELCPDYTIAKNHHTFNTGDHMAFVNMFPTVLRAQNDVFFIGLNSMDMNPGSKFRAAQGHFSYVQAARLKHLLDAIHGNNLPVQLAAAGGLFAFNVLFPSWTDPVAPPEIVGEKGQGDGFVSFNQSQNPLVETPSAADTSEHERTAPLSSSAKVIAYLHHHPLLNATDPSPFPSDENLASWAARAELAVESSTLLMDLREVAELRSAVEGRISALCFGHLHFSQLWKGHWNIPVCFAASSTPKSMQYREVRVLNSGISWYWHSVINTVAVQTISSEK